MNTEELSSKLCDAHNALMWAHTELFTHIGYFLGKQDESKFDPDLLRLAILYRIVDDKLKARNKALDEWKPTTTHQNESIPPGN